MNNGCETPDCILAHCSYIHNGESKAMNCSILVIWLQYVPEQDAKTEILEEKYYKRNKLQCV